MNFVAGRKNFHLKGLNSYVISERTSQSVGMVRVFHNTGDALPELVRNGVFCIAPHNHRQDISLTLLNGSVYNVDFKFDSRAPEKHFWEWKFKSAIVDGDMATQYHGTGDLRVVNIQPLARLHALFLSSASIHCIIASPGASWLIEEGALAPPKQHSLCYSRHSGFSLSMADLYEPMTAEEVSAIRL